MEMLCYSNERKPNRWTIKITLRLWISLVEGCWLKMIFENEWLSFDLCMEEKRQLIKFNKQKDSFLLLVIKPFKYEVNVNFKFFKKTFQIKLILNARSP